MAGRIDQATIAGHGGKHAGLDLAEVGSHDAMAGLGGDDRSHDRWKIVEAGRCRHASGGTIRTRPLATKPAVAHMLVEPVPTERGGDALVLAPGEECVDQRVGRSKLFESPGPGVREVVAVPTQHRLHLAGVAQVHRVR